MKQHKTETDEIMDIMFTMENEFEERQNDAKQEFQSLRDEIKNKVVFLFKEIIARKLSLPSV